MRRRALLRTLALSVALLGAGTLPAQATAAPATPATAPVARAVAEATADATAQVGPGLLLTLSGPGSGGARSVRLQCDPPGGSHPRPLAACGELAEAGGDPDALAGEPGFCPLNHDPVTASAYGEFMGQPLSWRKTFTNACALRRATTPVFDF
ncbi:SSI family serine proteinase inhibitor [Streptomyces sp. NPDC000594]|uniref:SSI family serine proteinase inhibitor n=1 Tax=Streptomyces sp. NPDC000594 TaxID=3154261 RepID=UPI00332639F0